MWPEEICVSPRLRLLSRWGFSTCLPLLPSKDRESLGSDSLWRWLPSLNRTPVLNYYTSKQPTSTALNHYNFGVFTFGLQLPAFTGSFNSTSSALSGKTLVCYMKSAYHHYSYKYISKWHHFIKDFLGFQWSLWRAFDLKIIYWETSWKRKEIRLLWPNGQYFLFLYSGFQITLLLFIYLFFWWTK